MSDPDYKMPSTDRESFRLFTETTDGGVALYQMLKQWKEQATAAADQEPPLTDAQLKALVHRFGKLCGWLAEAMRLGAR